MALILTTNSQDQLDRTCDLVIKHGCRYSLLPEPENDDQTLVVVGGTDEQLEAFLATGKRMQGLW